MNLLRQPQCIAILIWALSALMVFSLFKTAQHGVYLAKRSAHDYRSHRNWAWTSAAVTFGAVCVIEPTFRLYHLPYTDFFWAIHFPLLILYALSLILALIFNGRKQRATPDSEYPLRHNQLGRYAQWFGLFTALTGDWLVFVLIWPRP